MYRIYFENRSICICSENEPYYEDSNAVILRLNKDRGIGKTISLFEKDTNLKRLYIPSADPDRLFRKTCRHFSEIDAGGGLVKNRRGDFLMIYRNGVWDLPKGKREKGEKRKSTALREVREETGLTEIIAGAPICITHRCYRWKGQGDLILKHTYWYHMDYTAPVELIPQTEEDITKAAWIAASSLPQFLSNTYPSIVEVFKRAKII